MHLGSIHGVFKGGVYLCTVGVVQCILNRYCIYLGEVYSVFNRVVYAHGAFTLF